MTIQALKQAIINEVAAIDQDLWRRVNNYFQRLQECIDINRGHIPNILTKIILKVRMAYLAVINFFRIAKEFVLHVKVEHLKLQ